jgi:phosphoglycolate phosphatase
MKSNPRPLVIFDVDGTLVETAEDILAAVNHVTASLGIAPLTMKNHRALVGFGGRRLIREAFRAADRQLADSELEAIFRKFISYYEANVAHHSRLFEGALESLHLLHKTGHDLAICTNKSTGPCCALLSALQIDHLFCAVVANDTFPWSKPDPRVLQATIKMAKADPARSIMVGDSRTDIDAARAAGIPVIAVNFGYSDVPVGDLEPDWIIPDFDALYPAARALLDGF